MDKGYYVIEYTNDYAECDELRYVYGTYDAAEAYADDTVEDYGAQYEYMIDSDDQDDIDYYYENCGATIREATAEEIAEEDFEEI